MVKISVITVCFNAASTLEETILSVLNQAYPNIEYIIIDGGSTDSSVDIIKKYADKLAYWVSEPDKGIYNAMNKGLKYAHGDFVYFLGADDLLCSNILNEVAPLLITNEVYYGNVYMKNTKQKYWGKFNSFTLVVKNIPHQATFYPRKIYVKYIYEEKYIYLADYYLNLQLWRKRHFHYIPYTIAIYNDEGSSSVNVDKCFENDRFYILCSTLPWYCYPYILIRRIRTIIGNYVKK